MLQSIKDWFFFKDFKSDSRPKGHRVAGFNDMHSVCILFDGTTEEERKIIHKFKKAINPSGKKNVKSLAFINNALALDNVDYPAYNLKDVKWTGKPFGLKVDEFINLKFDLLIVMCKNMLPHFEYIIAHSEASFIIGPSIPKAEKYFNITVGTDPNPTTEVIIKKIISAIDKIAVKK